MPGAAGRARTSCLCLHGRPSPKAATLDLLEEGKGLREVRTAAREEAIADQDQREAEHRHADDWGILLETENQDLGAMERKFSEWEKNHAQHPKLSKMSVLVIGMCTPRPGYHTQSIRTACQCGRGMWDVG